MPSKLILLTGVSGYLGSHIAHQLLKKGYQVRGTARGAKLASVKEAYSSYGDKFEVVCVNDISSDDVSEHLKGVHGVIHSAAPLGLTNPDPQQVLNGAIRGSVNVISQAEKAGIKKIVYTSSISTAMNASGALYPSGLPNLEIDPSRPVLTAADYNPITMEQAIAAGDSQTAYFAGKSLAEKAVWDLAEAYPHLDITCFNAPCFFGPLTPEFITPIPPSSSTLSTAYFIYELLKPNSKFIGPNGFADVRDVALAHVLALTSPPSSEAGVAGRKRLFIGSPYRDEFTWKDVMRLIAERRPKIKDRLAQIDTNTGSENAIIPVDLTLLEKFVGMGYGSLTKWQDTVLDTVDSLLALEKEWIDAGFTPDSFP